MKPTKVKCGSEEASPRAKAKETIWTNIKRNPNSKVQNGLIATKRNTLVLIQEEISRSIMLSLRENPRYEKKPKITSNLF